MIVHRVRAAIDPAPVGPVRRSRVAMIAARTGHPRCGDVTARLVEAALTRGLVTRHWARTDTATVVPRHALPLGHGGSERAP